MAGVASSSSSSSEDLTSTPAPTAQPDAVDVLLQRRKCELMYELKNIQHGERPVTGSESRGKVDHFFSRRIQIQESSTPVANTDDVEEHRPQQVTIEVQGLLQTRSVSSLLQSQRFRRSLENAVRSHFSNPSSRPATSTTTSSRPTTATASSAPTTATASSAPSTATSTADNLSHTSTIPPAPLLDSSLLAQPTHQQSNETDDSTTATSTTTSEPEVRHLNLNEEDVRRWTQEEFVMEISELVHRQLVSSSLHSPFRNRLERHIQSRVQSSGINGQAIQEQIQRLPPSHIRRNDFSHLGIPSAQDQQLDDAVSLISATASATIPYAQSNAAVQREMHTMKSQISKLTSMLKTSLDLQMDIQRSIKQEVAAAINQSNASAGNQSNITSAGTQYNSRRADDSKCIICLEGDADAVLYRCGHLCMCYTCALRMRGDSGICPVCRAPITDVLRAYRISHQS